MYICMPHVCFDRNSGHLYVCGGIILGHLFGSGCSAGFCLSGELTLTTGWFLEVRQQFSVYLFLPSLAVSLVKFEGPALFLKCNFNTFLLELISHHFSNESSFVT